MTTNEDRLSAVQGQCAAVVTVIVAVPVCGPAVIRDGLTAYSQGTGRNCNARSTLIRGFVMPLPGSTMGVPVADSASMICVTPADGQPDFMIAHAPAT